MAPKPQLLPLFPVFLHILIAFHLDSDECVNVISGVRKDEKARLSSSSVCLGEMEKKNPAICEYGFAEKQVTPFSEYQ